MKISWVEILLITAILLLVASAALRVTYGRQWLAWEYDLIESWGMSRVTYDLVKTSIFIAITATLTIRYRRKQRKEDSRSYELPKT